MASEDADDRSGRCSIRGTPEQLGGVYVGALAGDRAIDRIVDSASGPRVLVDLDDMQVGETLVVAEPSVLLRGKLVERTRRRTRELRALVATGVLAIGVPTGAAWYTNARTGDLAEVLTAAGGERVTIGSVDADLGGSIRLTDVAFGDLVSADAIEGSVAMGSLLDGHLRADEIYVDGPRVAIRVDGDGDSDVARLARRLATRAGSSGGGTGGSATSVRRIVVAGGTLVARVAGIGELSAEGVELLPDHGGVRIVTGPVRVRHNDARLAVDVAFERSAAELGLPQMRFGRVLAVGGAGTVSASGGLADGLVLRDLAAGRRAPGGTLEVRGAIDDGGIARPIAVDVGIGRGQPDGGLAIAVRGDRVPLRAFSTFAPHGIELGDARGTGTLAIRRDPHATEVQLSIDGKLEQLAVDHRAVGPDPFALTAGVRGEVTVAAEAITLSHAELTIGAIALAADGSIRRGAPLSGRLEVKLADAPCADLLASVPEALRGPLDGMVVAGSLAGRARLAVDLGAADGDGAKLTSSLAGGCRVTAEPPAADVSQLGAPSEQQLADGTRARIGRGEAGWTPLRGLPDHVGGAFVSAEDGRFFDHDGFDLNQIARSLEIDLREHRLVRGGSTISQQLVKNAFLSQRRSFDRKLQEAILTWRLEARLGKKQILERYLNVIELGPHVFGITAAARYWFDTTPRELSVKQAAFLAALTSQPSTMSRRIRRTGTLDADSAERVAVVLRAMRRTAAIGPATYDLAKTEPLHFAATAVPSER